MQKKKTIIKNSNIADGVLILYVYCSLLFVYASVYIIQTYCHTC